MKPLFALQVVMILWLALHCGKSGKIIPSEDGGISVGKTGAVVITDPELMPPEQKFLTASEPGKWNAEKANHVPFVQLTASKKPKTWDIKISMGYQGSGAHYTEFIMLLNRGNKEIAKKIFSRGESAAEVTFEYTEKEGERLYALAKCSMHDTWVAEVNLPAATR